MKCKQKIHRGWQEKERARLMGIGNLPSVIGKYQYIYSSDKGKISLIELPNYFQDKKNLWEIYCLEGMLFEDIERFDSKEDAEVRIKDVLEQ